MSENPLAMMSTREVSQNLNTAKKAADKAPLLITERGEAGYVLMNYQHYLQLLEKNSDNKIYSRDDADNIYRNIINNLIDIDAGINGIMSVFGFADNIMEVLDKIDKTSNQLNQLLYNQKKYEYFIQEFFKDYRIEKIE